jgi:hypothetical protein
VNIFLENRTKMAPPKCVKRGRIRLLIVFFCRDLEGGTFTVYTLGEGDTDIQNIEEFYTATPEV